AYAVARVSPRTLSVAPGMGLASSRTNLPLLSPRAPGWAPALAEQAWPWGWLAIVFLPPLALLLVRTFGGGRTETPAPTPARVSGTRLGRLEREFQAMLVAYVANAEGLDGDALASSLRAAGLERAVAGHVVRLRDRLRAARYGPQGTGDQAELAEELTQVLKVLG